MAVSAVLRCALLRRAAGAAPCRAVPRHAVCVAYVTGGRVGVSETLCGVRAGYLTLTLNLTLTLTLIPAPY